MVFIHCGLHFRITSLKKIQKKLSVKKKLQGCFSFFLLEIFFVFFNLFTPSVQKIKKKKKTTKL